MRHQLPRNAKALKEFRSDLRQRMPSPEVMLWQQLRGVRLGVRFRRQFSIGRMIVDFYAPSVRVAIEIDGDSHYARNRPRDRDMRRDAVLARDGILVLRFTNHDITHNLPGVYERIREVVVSRSLATPLLISPSSRARGSLSRGKMDGERPFRPAAFDAAV